MSSITGAVSDRIQRSTGKVQVSSAGAITLTGGGTVVVFADAGTVQFFSNLASLNNLGYLTTPRIYVQQTGASAAVLAIRTDGGAGILGAGSAFATFCYDDSQVFHFRAASRANVEAAVLNTGTIAITCDTAANNARVGINKSSSIGAQLHVVTGASSVKGLIVAATSGQSANLIEVQGQHGDLLAVHCATENLTLSTSGTTTNTSANLLPANALILAVVCRVTTTITTATNWSVGDSTTAARFSSANGTLTAGTTSVGLNHQQGAVTTDAAGPVQVSATTVRITTTGTPGAGAIRITVYYISLTAPTS